MNNSIKLVKLSMMSSILPLVRLLNKVDLSKLAYLVGRKAPNLVSKNAKKIRNKLLMIVMTRFQFSDVVSLMKNSSLCAC